MLQRMIARLTGRHRASSATTCVWLLLGILVAPRPTPAQTDIITGIESTLVGAVDPGEIVPDLPFNAIPPLDEPLFVPAEMGAIADDDFVIGVAIGGEAVAYPVKILNFHEIVTHTVGGQRVSVTYCPLTNSGVVFDAPSITFGNTGALFNNNVVMYDRTSRSFWSQMALGSIFGERAGEHLDPLPVIHTRFGAWRQLFPESSLLSSQTGYNRNYAVDPFESAGYTHNHDIYFPQGISIDGRLHPKEMVFGVARDGSALAYPYSRLAEIGVVNDELDGDDIVLFYDDDARLALGFGRQLGDRLLHFVQSDDAEGALPLFEDVETRSRWNILGRSVAGPLEGSRLTPIATYSAYWFGWASFWRDSDIWDGDTVFPSPDTAVEKTTWGLLKLE